MNLTDQDFIRIVEYVKDRYGINLIKKRLLIEGRLYFTVTNQGYKNFKDYIDHVFSNPDGEEMTNFINRITTNHTFFMRERQHFDYLVSTILPHLERTVTDKDLRIWSAGCSFGHEPYNLAMYIDDYFGATKNLWDTKILATDISKKALGIAKSGIYKDTVISELPIQWQEKYFTKISNTDYQIIEKIRKDVAFKYFNLMEDIVPKKPFDLILCRNVMIYFDSETKEKLIKKFYDAIKPGGYLFIGHAENITKNTQFKQVMPAIFQK